MQDLHTIAVDTIFTQMSAKKGIKRHIERETASM